MTFRPQRPGLFIALGLACLATAATWQWTRGMTGHARPLAALAPTADVQRGLAAFFGNDDARRPGAVPSEAELGTMLKPFTDPATKWPLPEGGVVSSIDDLPYPFSHIRQPHRPILWVGGDSGSTELGSSLCRWSLRNLGLPIRRFHKPATGLARLDHFDWHQALAEEMQKYDPSVIVIYLGGNDGQNLVTEGCHGYAFGSQPWRAEYASRFNRAMDILSEGNRRVFWIGLPISRLEKYSERIKVLNRFYQEELAKRPNATFVSTWEAMCDEKGNYAESLTDLDGKSHRMRSGDGIHFYPIAADRMLRPILGALTEAFDQMHPMVRQQYMELRNAREAKRKTVRTTMARLGQG